MKQLPILKTIQGYKSILASNRYAESPIGILQGIRNRHPFNQVTPTPGEESDGNSSSEDSENENSDSYDDSDSDNSDLANLFQKSYTNRNEQ